jgi:2-polyprenyl-3-methyl-5-hydroxy-6-metoxy-1,4-benzoquinol methylase
VHSFLLPPGRYERVDLTLDTGQTFTQEGPIQIASAPYASLLSESRVLPRSSIYGSGPPDAHFNPDILDACLALDGTILDFGCGTGALVRALRAKGRDARGLDLAIPIIQKAILNEARPHITLYDGQFPSPLKDGVADIVVSTEVIEHVPPYEEYLAELARLTRRHAVISTPDIAAIPLGAPSFSVPWHLLEATHVNFFTQASLGRLLEKHFSRVEFSRTVPAQLSGAAYFVSLLAFCEK